MTPDRPPDRPPYKSNELRPSISDWQIGPYVGKYVESGRMSGDIIPYSWRFWVGPAISFGLEFDPQVKHAAKGHRLDN